MTSGKNTKYPHTIHKDLKPLFDQALGAGWDWRWTGTGHIRLISPSGQTGVTLSATPRNAWRTARNLRRDLRRAGLAV